MSRCNTKTISTTTASELTYCCLPEGVRLLYQNKADTYGEFAVNPGTGTIVRIVINADLNEERDPDAPLIRSQVMVEYGSEELGGKTYICPQRSVEVSRSRSERELYEWGMVFTLNSYFETMINTVTFDGYHKFGSKIRILPGYEEPEETRAPAPLQKSTLTHALPWNAPTIGNKRICNVVDVSVNSERTAADSYEYRLPGIYALNLLIGTIYPSEQRPYVPGLGRVL